VLRENNQQLQLNVTPCASERSVVIFQQPYLKDEAGDIQCNRVTIKLVQVIQR
jgi:hypothetical protein